MTTVDTIKKDKLPYSRKNPCIGKFLTCEVLSKPGSSKENLHVVIDLNDPDFTYEVGSSFGIYPENPKEHVDELLHVLAMPKQMLVFDPRSETHFSLEAFLQKQANLSQVTSKHLEMIQRHVPSEKIAHLLEHAEERKTFLEGHDLFTFLSLFWKNSIPIEELVAITAPLLPRYYSIASSQKETGQEVHFMVASFSYEKAGRTKHSITAQYFKDFLLEKREGVRLFLQESPHFKLPQDPSTPLIMIGPGTGVAVFRGFLQERAHLGTPKGSHWLFTGDRNRAFDFHYEEEFLSYVEKGLLRLDGAFSRDTSEKVYVQDLMQREAKELWSWIKDKNASIYICGDAKHMAKDVQKTLLRIVEEEGSMTEESAKEFLSHLKKEGRLLLDVY